ncbi:MAG: nucleotidyltransferase domain-containing protein [Meiothermus sp.]|uniref:nucleotidyltransferase family protein n=1 Tax=Meiothermus sp. TaxID=1955249 RepID=UPI0025CCBEC1|nr:nucleotidyltransferase domain-containing protein [Meiothermus sp.]MCS7068935.1 nucleotidyltransferase domain-containing protein [Meiothermus sp.]MDW8425660.1 nucleotidyltransferase domain-containing protein [Meiothermus sp.]
MTVRERILKHLEALSPAQLEELLHELEARTRLPLTKEAVLALREPIRALARRCGVERLWLFGSVARGAAQAGSDVDFLAKFTRAKLEDRLDFKEGLEALLGRPVEVVEAGYLHPEVQESIWAEAIEL